MLKYLFLALIPVFIGFVFSLLRPRPAVTRDLVCQALQKLNAGAVLLDVREPGEFAAGHVRGAVNVPLAELRERAPALAPDKDAPRAGVLRHGPPQHRRRGPPCEDGLHGRVGLRRDGPVALPLER